MPHIPVVDSHLHLWDPQRLNYPWHAEAPALNRAFLLPDYAKACGDVPVERMVFLQCDVERSQSLEEVKFVSELATKEHRISGWCRSRRWNLVLPSASTWTS